MQMSVFAYVSLGLAVCVMVLAYVLSPDASLALSMLPMVLLLGGIPVLINFLNKRHVAKLDLRHVRQSRIKDVLKKEIGDQVRISGIVASVSQRWLNRPHLRVIDSSGEIGVSMFVAPQEHIRCGDEIEVVGTLRWAFGLKKKEKKIWGLQLRLYAKE